MDGILLVDKPKGWTSHDVVAKVRSVLRQSASLQSPVSSKKTLGTNDERPTTPSLKVKLGHTGTLDPMATGLLVLVVGSYTKRAQEFSKLDKTYEVTMKLGETSTTGDAEGEKTKVSDKKPSEKEIQAVLDSFVGEIEQTPPAYSAIKVNGQRAYKLARAGKELNLKPRIIKIHAIALDFIKFPSVKFTAEVSSGTYIRSLVQDIGQKLDTGAYMSELNRVQIGRFNLKDAIHELSAELIERTSLLK